LADFYSRNWRIPGFYEEKKLNIEPDSPLKPTKVGFIFIAAVNQVSQDVVRVGLKIGS